MQVTESALSWKTLDMAILAGKIQLLHYVFPVHCMCPCGLILIWYYNGHFLPTTVLSAGGTQRY